jgi:hypothetical protein
MERIFGAVVAVILGLLALAGVTAVASGAFGGDKASRVSSDISQVVTNARGGFVQSANGYTSFTTANEASLITAGVFPNTMVRAGAVVDAWGNAVTLGNSNNATIGTVTFGGGGSETAKSCASVVSTLHDYVTLTVGGTVFTPTNQPDANSAGAACGTSLTITVAFQ